MLMSQAENLTREEFRSRQWAKFHARLEVWYASNSFYRRLLREAHVAPSDIGAFDDLRRLPMVTKDDLVADQRARPPYGERLGVSPNDIFRIAMTGGTSGNEKVVQPMTEQDVETGAELTATAYRWGGVGPDDIFTFNVGFSNHTGGWAFYTGARKVARVPYIIGHEGFAGRVDLMRKFGVDGMFATPSALNGLTTTCHELGSRPADLFPNLKYILLGAEPYPIEFVLRMQEEWGAPIHENYGSTETHSAIAAATCEHGAVVDGRRGMLHFLESGFLMEVVDPETGEHVAPGEPGLFVITTLDKQASPMLRYNSQDRVVYTPHDACACGRPFAGIEAGTIGRWDDMLKIKNTNIFPSQIDDIVFSTPGVAEYQGEVFIGSKGRDEARIRLAFVPEAEGTAHEVLATLERTLRERLEIRFDLVLVERSDLPAFSSGETKARRWVDRRQEQLV